MALTASQKRHETQLEYNAALPGCSARQLLEAMSSKWVSLVMLALSEGQQRHSEVRRQIPGASQKMLTSTLRSLERDGLVPRSVTPTVPARTDYELTTLGHSLLCVIHEMKDWAEANMDEVARARLEHDDGRSIAGS